MLGSYARILVPNDDGVHSEGSRRSPMRPAPREVTVVAPIQEASAIGHALTLRRPLRIGYRGGQHFAVDGTQPIASTSRSPTCSRTSRI